MTLQETLTAAQSAVVAATEALTEAHATATKAQEAVNAAMPHMALLQRIEVEVANVPAEVAGRLTQVLSEARALINL